MIGEPVWYWAVFGIIGLLILAALVNEIHVWRSSRSTRRMREEWDAWTDGRRVR